MKNKFNQLLDEAKSAGNKIKEKAGEIGQAAADKAVHTLEHWLDEFPRIESYGLKICSFSFIMAISPKLEVEMTGSHADFSTERLDEIIAELKGSSLSAMIYKAIRTTYSLHSKVAQDLEDPLIVKIRLSITPEVSVFIGRPLVN